MLSLWFSDQERKDRTKHFFCLLTFFICLSTLLICWIVPTLAKGAFPLSKPFSFLKSQNVWAQTFKYSGLALLVIFGFIFAFGSIREIFSLVTPPIYYRRAKKFNWLFTFLIFAPLICTLCVEKRGGKWDISNATQYLLFQLYFFIANRVSWRFFVKFLLPDIVGEDALMIKKVGGKLTKQHYLGWTSFFLLAFYLPIWALILVVAISFFSNSFSFVFGRKLGVTRLSDYSPTKTLEGTICSALLSVIVFSALSIYAFKAEWFGKGNFHDKEIGFIAFVIFLVGAASLLSNWGDCTFSLCKRALGYKNFGRLFGDKVGGFWDRFDSLSSSLFFTSIVFWAVLGIIHKGIGIPFNGK